MVLIQTDMLTPIGNVQGRVSQDVSGAIASRNIVESLEKAAIQKVEDDDHAVFAGLAPNTHGTVASGEICEMHIMVLSGQRRLIPVVDRRLSGVDVAFDVFS